MHVKQDNPISGIFDAFSDDEEHENLWPSLADLPPVEPVVEPSGYRPAPVGAELPAENDPRDAVPESAVPTPRELHFSAVEPWADAPLPVVTAKTEPTQRGLGIPPPPSAREAAWFHQMPSLVSVPPLTMDAIERGSSTAPIAPAEPTENERVTVRAPALTGLTPRQKWRRAVSVALLAAALFLSVVFARREAVPPEGSAVAQGSPAVLQAAFEPARAPAPTLPAPAATATDVPAVAQNDVDQGASREDLSTRESRRKKRRHGHATQADLDVAAGIARVYPTAAFTTPAITPVAAGTNPGPSRESLTLPPR
jgi:hypothetical protein